MSKEEKVKSYLNDAEFVRFLKERGISMNGTVDVLYPYTVEYDTRQKPVACDGNLSV